MGLWPLAFGGLGSILQYGETRRLSDIEEQRRQELLDFLDEVQTDPQYAGLFNADFNDSPYFLLDGKPIGGPYTGNGQDIVNLNNLFGTDVSYDPTAIDELIGETGTRRDEALDESRARYGTQLTDARALYDRGRADIGGLFGAERGRLAGEKIAPGSTFDLLDLADPEEIYRASLDAGNRNALQTEQATIDQTGSELFRESARLGRDPFDAGIPTQTREAARSRRLSDFGGARLGAEGQKLSALASNSATKQAALASEQQRNTAIDQAIAALTGQEAGEYGDLTTEQSATETAIQNALEEALGTTRGIYEPQVTNLGIAREQNIGAGQERELQREKLAGDYAQNQTVIENQAEQADAERLFNIIMQKAAAIGMNPQVVFDYLGLTSHPFSLRNASESPDTGGGFFGG
mgnify:CR=1 FL=1